MAQPAQQERSSGSRPRGHIPALTGLRCIAATWVMLFHYRSMLGPYVDQVPFARPVLDGGWIGVELFFVLSGFVLARKYIDEVGRRPTPAVVLRFLWNRIARVWPAWAVVTVLMGAWIWGLRAAGWNADLVDPHPATDVMAFLRQLTMTQMWGRQSLFGASYLVPGWSISAEWLAYLAFPVLCVVLRPLSRLHPWINLVLAQVTMMPLVFEAYRHGPPDFTENWVMRIACAFTAGTLLALALKDLERSARVERVAWLVTWIAPVVVVLVCAWATWHAAGQPGVDYHGVAVGAYPALIAALTLTDRGPSRWLARPALVYGGKISYCLYLVHFAVLEALLTVIWQNPAVRFKATPSLVLVMPVVLVVACCLAAALHHGVEEPGQRLLARLAGGGRRSTRRHAAASRTIADPVLPAVPTQRRVRPQGWTPPLSGHTEPMVLSSLGGGVVPSPEARG